MIDCSGDIGEQARPKHLGLLCNLQLRESEIVGAVSGSTKPIRKREPAQNPKLRYFKPFELFDHTGCLRGCRYLLHDRDTKFCQSFRELIESGSVNPLRLPARSPNLNSQAERWVRSVKEECLSRLILIWRIVAAASVAAISRTLPPGAQPSGQRQSDSVSFADGGKKEHWSSAVSRTTGRPAEVLREGSGIRVDGTAGDGLTISTYIKDAGNLPWQKTSHA